MSKTPTPHRRPGARAAVLVAIGVALGFSAYHGLRTVELSDASAAADEAPSTTAPVTTPVTEVPTTPPPTTAAPTTAAPTTAAPTTTTTTAVPGPPTYRAGDQGPEIAAMQERLLALGFWVPVADGDYGSLTQQAVMAFQKHVGLSRDGLAGPATMAALETAAPVTAREGGDHVEIDLERQLLIVVRGRTLAFNTSTGASGWRTPPGRFTVDREIDGVRHAELGDLYRPKYFNAGIAVHGSPSIPGRPASHGCARVHDRVMDLLWNDVLMPVGTPVWVY